MPLIIVSPFAKPHFVSHTPMDYTAVLKFVEKRFNLPNLNARDAAQADMEEFFDFSSPNLNPPSPASQPLNLPCNAERRREPRMCRFRSRSHQHSAISQNRIAADFLQINAEEEKQPRIIANYHESKIKIMIRVVRLIRG